MLNKIKKIFGGKDSLKTSGPVPIEEYVEIPVKVYDDTNTIKIKVCDLEDLRDVTDIAIMLEAGYLVIANTINLERDLDDDYVKILTCLKNKVATNGGKIVRLCDNKIMVVPNNTVIEKLVKEDEKVKKIPSKHNTEIK
ncbi:MAG: hypothetical protein PWP15_834 [Methanothermococcus sp.]|uniref:cell division protein SepF n=1 Tax=Methanothermococcus TaxID=155862 RepID=UPI000379F281|nr:MULTISPECIES: cell division protein SepF [Methanothermococcus]MDK2790327.1 hypothetical protein [Methanothermococcus sp.]MDK2987137.1 hypothetical protein [Methanothermococcus sp.]